jgi:hypothetical protein
MSLLKVMLSPAPFSNFPVNWSPLVKTSTSGLGASFAAGGAACADICWQAKTPHDATTTVAIRSTLDPFCRSAERIGVFGKIEKREKDIS